MSEPEVEVKIGFKPSVVSSRAYLTIETSGEPTVSVLLDIMEITKLAEMSAQVVSILADNIKFAIITQDLNLDMEVDSDD